MIRPGQTLKPMVKLPRDPSSCWQWLGFIHPESGVAVKALMGRCMPARRWMWEQLFGPIPKGYVIAQKCGVQSCVNPHHLACMTLADALRAGLAAKLMPSDITEIRRIYETEKARKAGSRFRPSELSRRLAHDYAVSPQAIRDVFRGDTWRNRTKHPTAVTPSEKRA